MKRPALAATIPWAIWVSGDRNKLPGAIRGRHGRSLRNWLRRGRNRNCPETHCPSKSERKVVGSSHHNDARKHEDRAVGPNLEAGLESSFPLPKPKNTGYGTCHT
jgi:hypothetical protein